jgi:hypothetical protein
LGVKKAKISFKSPKTEFGAQNQYGRVIYPFTIHKTLIRPVLLYGNETWVLTKREEKQLLVFERKVLRTICGSKIENGVYRKRYNHDSSNALNATKTSRLHYAGHMIRRPEDLPKKALFRAKPNERRNQGRPKSRWADGVNSDTLALGVRDWRDLLQQALTRFWL